MEEWTCAKCGVCCRDVSVSAKEYKILHVLANARERRLLESQQKHDEKLGLYISGTCPFLYHNGDASTYCRIYENRPAVCHWYPPPNLREYPKCKDECQGSMALSNFWITGAKFQMVDGSVVDPVLTMHQEYSALGSPYYLMKKDTPADAAGTTASQTTADTGRFLMRQWVFQLTGIAKILATVWTVYYRAYASGGTAHMDIKIDTIKNDTTVRDSIADNVANSSNLGTSYATMTGTHAFAEYTVVDQTDWLNISVYTEVTVSQSGKKVYYRFDDNTLAEADQSRIAFVVFAGHVVTKLSENLSVISTVPRRVYNAVRPIRLNLSAIRDVFSRRMNYARKLLEAVVISDVLRKILSFPRKMVENLSALKDMFTRRLSYLRRLIEDLSSIRDVFSYVKVAFIKVFVFVQTLFIQALFTRRASYTRKIVDSTLIQDVLKRFVGFPRRFTENLSVLQAIFVRRLNFLRRFVENLSVIRDVFSFVYVPIVKIYRFVQTVFVQAFLIRRVSYIRKVLNQTVVSDVFKRFVGLPRKFVEDLSILREVFSRRVAYVRKLPQNLSILRDVFSFVYIPVIKVYRLIQTMFIQAVLIRRVSYLKKLVNFTFIQDIFKRVVGFPRRLTQNLSAISARFIRTVSYSRRFMQSTLVSDVFKRFVGFPRRFLENLSALKDIFVRRASFLRRFVEDLSVLKDVFSFILVPLVKVYRLVQTLIIQALLIRRVSILRKIVNAITISEVFKRLIGFPRRLIQNLSVISVGFLRKMAYTRRLLQTTLVKDVLRRIVGFPRKMIQDLSVLATIFRRRITSIRILTQAIVIQDMLKRITSYLRAFKETVVVRDLFKRIQAFTRRLTQTLIVSDVFKRIVGLPRRFIENLSTISSVFVRRVGLLRRLVQTVPIQDVFRRIQALTRALRQDLSINRDVFIRKISYLRRLPQFTYIQAKFSFLYVPLIRIYRFVQTLIVSTLLRRRVAFTRTLRQNLSVFQARFSFIYAPLVRIYRFVQNLSVIGDVFRYQIVTPTIVYLQRKATLIQAEIQDLYEKVRKKAEFYLGK